MLANIGESGDPMGISKTCLKILLSNLKNVKLIIIEITFNNS